MDACDCGDNVGAGVDVFVAGGLVWVYDPVGNQSAHTDRRSNTTNYTFDNLNRVVETREINVQRLRDYEAIRMMEDQDEHLWVYRDAESDRLRILTRQSNDQLHRFDLVDD